MKKVLFNTILVGGLALSILTLNSNSGGAFKFGLSCGGSGCHGAAQSANVATTVVVNGLPGSYVLGASYPLTVTVAHASFTKAGFNLAASGGAFVAGSNSAVNNAPVAQASQVSPVTMVAGVATFDVIWKAPTTGSLPITFSVAGNAVNGNGGPDAMDSWNTNSQVVNAAPAGNRDINPTAINCYPNPTTDNITIDGINADTKIVVVNMQGQMVNTTASFNADKCVVNCSNLPTGAYLLNAINAKGKSTTTFIKN
jgi:Secretion system C-terminal sorting domain